MGFLWSRIICEMNKPDDISELAMTSEFAEVLTSFSTISQEKRHAALPSWSFPSCCQFEADL